MNSSTATGVRRLSAARSKRDHETPLCGDGLVTIVEGARFLGVSKTTLYDMLGRGEIAYSRVGHLKRIPRRALIEYAEKHLVRHRDAS